MSNQVTFKRRLLKLADFLETVPRKRFDYMQWVGKDWDGKSSLNNCGTTACALGWATAIPSLRRAGLRLKRRVPSNYVCLKEESPNYDSASRAAEKVFGLSFREFMWLFVPGDGHHKPSFKATPKQVARHIRRFVKNGGVP